MTERYALREPMVWLVFGLPLAAVIASFWLLASAISSGGADEIADVVQTTGDAHVTDLGPDAHARSMNLSAVLHMEKSAVDVYPVTGVFARRQVLVLTLSHPTDARRDRRVVLQPDATGWRVPDDMRAGHDWNVQLAPADQTWRLRGRIKAGELAAHLSPALTAD
jgi:hypothetical protein